MASIDQAVELATQVVAQVKAADMAAPTPCSEWNVRQLVNHMVSELAWVPELLQGKTIADVGDKLDGDLVGQDLQQSWRACAVAAQTAVQNSSPDQVVHVSYGDVPADGYIQEVAGDIFIHTWDLAQGIGAEFHIPEDVAKELFDKNQPNIVAWRKAGLVGDEVSVPADASAEVRLLALFGRRA